MRGSWSGCCELAIEFLCVMNEAGNEDALVMLVDVMCLERLCLICWN